MTLQDTPVFNRAFNALAELYHLSEYEDQRLRCFQTLSDLDIGAVEIAFSEVTKRAGVGSLEYFPKPGQIRELASTVQRTSAASQDCDKCGGTGMMNAEPDKSQIERMYDQVSAQPTVTRCECR